MPQVPDFLEGAVDLHVHSAPDVDVRRYDDLELAREAARARMRAILIKSHQNSTVERAWLGVDSPVRAEGDNAGDFALSHNHG